MERLRGVADLHLNPDATHIANTFNLARLSFVQTPRTTLALGYSPSTGALVGLSDTTFKRRMPAGR